MTELNTAATQTVPSPPRSMPPPALDWGRGRYERTAEVLVPAAQAVVDAARLQRGERVLDVGAGTGNVALIAARAGARVTAVDPAARLREVVRAEAAREGLDIEVLAGDAAALPVPDHSVDAVLSNFAVIFAPDPAAAIAEMARVLTSQGRIVFSAWLPGDTLGRYATAANNLVRGALGAPAPPAPFPWHDPAALAPVFAAHAMTVALDQHDISFTAASAADYLDDDRVNHPMAITGFEILQRAGQAEAACQSLLRILDDANESPDAFRITQRYVVVSATSR
jgi:SAM-dependent methyltransferase